MDKGILWLLLRYRWCKHLDVCIGCDQSLKHGGVLCSMCKLYSYCSPKCLVNDVTCHRPACEIITSIEGDQDVIPEYLLKRVAEVKYRAKLLDSEGDFITPAVIREAYLIRNSDSFIQNVSTLLTESNKTDTTICEDDIQEQNQKKSHTNVTLGFTVNNRGNRKAAGKPQIFQEHSSFRTDWSFSASILESGCFGRPFQIKAQRNMDTEIVQETSNTIQDRLKNQKQQVDGHSKLVSDNHKIQSDSKERSEDCDEGQCRTISGAENNASSDDHIVEGNIHSSSSICSSDNQSSGKIVASKKTKVNEIQDTFGSGWWGKHKENSSKKSTQANKLKQTPVDEKISCRERKRNESTKSHISSSLTKNSQTRKQSESNTFGSGWWQGNMLSHSKTGASSAAKTKTLQDSVPGEHKQDATSTSSTSTLSNRSSSNSALSNNVSSNTSNNSTSSNDANSNKSTNNSTSSSKSTKNSTNHNDANSNKFIKTKTSSNISTSNSTNNNNANSNKSTNSIEKTRTKRKSESETFGSGWWKQHAVGSKEKQKPAKSKTDKASSKMDRQESEQQNKSTSTYRVNKCMDLIPYRIRVTPGHFSRFTKVARVIPSHFIEEEAHHGRNVVMGLIDVPGLWRASLGGSHISLVVEIVCRYPSSTMPGIIVRDNHGHTAPVLLNTDESSLYNIAGLLSVQISDCLLPGTFILLRAVNWQELPTGELIIVMMDIADVEFIFYEALV